MTNKLSHF